MNFATVDNDKTLLLPKAKRKSPMVGFAKNSTAVYGGIDRLEASPIAEESSNDSAYYLDRHGSTFPTKQTDPRPLSLNVVGLTYKVKIKKGHWWNGSCLKPTFEKTVLDNVCMSFSKGEISALVGTSGSGKTSFLDVVSGRAQGTVTGVVEYKHEQCTLQMMREKSSYVLQADRLLSTLTVRETLTYMAYIKLPSSRSYAEIDAKVHEVIEDMGLLHVADTRIGGAVVRGVSGGERRRITIGVQLLKDPEILLLDEPTSGLDAFTARHLVSSLADLAHKGNKLVLMSIHQPRPDIFHMLDKIGILTVGEVAFLGSPSDMIPYFESIGFPCPQDQNPLDVYIDLTSVDRRTPDTEQKTMKLVHTLCNKFAKSDLQKKILSHITTGLNYHYDYSQEETDHERKSRHNKPSWIRIFLTLLVRMNIHLWRDRGNCLGRILMLPFFIPFIVIFLGRVGNNLESIQDRLGIIYQAMQVPPYMGLTNAVTLFPTLRQVFYRECYDGLYSVSTFIITFFIHILPFNILTSFVFAASFYWILGMRDDLVAFGSFTLVTVVLVQFGEMVTVCVMSVLRRDTQVANNFAALIFTASGLLSSGLLRNIESMPVLLQKVGYAAIHKYTSEIIIGNEFDTLTFDCGNQTCPETGESFLNQNFPGALDHMTRNFSIIGGYVLASFFIAIFLFKIRGLPTLH